MGIDTIENPLLAKIKAFEIRYLKLRFTFLDLMEKQVNHNKCNVIRLIDDKEMEEVKPLKKYVVTLYSPIAEFESEEISLLATSALDARQRIKKLSQYNDLRVMFGDLSYYIVRIEEE